MLALIIPITFRDGRKRGQDQLLEVLRSLLRELDKRVCSKHWAPKHLNFLFEGFYVIRTLPFISFKGS